MDSPIELTPADLSACAVRCEGCGWRGKGADVPATGACPRCGRAVSWTVVVFLPGVWVHSSFVARP